MATRADVDKLDSTCLLQTLTAVRKGDFSVRLPNTWAGIDGKIADTLNDIIEMMSDSTEEIERVSRVVGVIGGRQRHPDGVGVGGGVGVVEGAGQGGHLGLSVRSAGLVVRHHRRCPSPRGGTVDRPAGVPADIGVHRSVDMVRGARRARTRARHVAWDGCP